MTFTTAVSHADIERLRRNKYNANVTAVIKLHDELMILRVKPDGARLKFEPGQYTVLGLGYWEPRVAGSQPEELTPKLRDQLIKRAYSISCRLVDDNGTPVTNHTDSETEFYLTLVRAAKKPPALTPRLFHLKTGDRVYLGPHAHGHYTLQRVEPNDQVVLAATGTGEAPHNAMVAELFANGHRGAITSITCVRYRKDLGYLDRHRILEQRFENYHYIPLTTREPQNLDEARLDYAGKRYLQDLFESSGFSDASGCRLDPNKTHIFLCGSPAMIGVPDQTLGAPRRYPQPKGMVEVLEQRGFRVDRPGEPGNIHFEKYW